MKSIEARFKREYVGGVSAIVALFRAIKDQGFAKRVVSKNFSELVPKTDYDKKDRKELLEWLFSA